MASKSKPDSEKNRAHNMPNYVKFAISGLAGVGAVGFVHPLDVVKMRMQLSGEGGKTREFTSSIDALMGIPRREGLKSLYSGFTASVARQLAYTMTRLGVFQVAVDAMAKEGHKGLVPQIGSSLLAGFIASVVANPTDVALVRMTSDKRLPQSERRNYKNVVNAIARIGREEGLTGLWSGALPTIMRALLGNVTQLVTYVQSKDFLLRNDYMKDGIACHFLASLTSGFVYAFSTCPLDVAKTRIQTMKTIKGVPEYSGLIDVWNKTVKKEGFTALWKGFTPYYVRIAPNTNFQIWCCNAASVGYTQAPKLDDGYIYKSHVDQLRRYGVQKKVSFEPTTTHPTEESTGN